MRKKARNKRILLLFSLFFKVINTDFETGVKLLYG